MGILHLGPFAEQGVRFIEEKDPVFPFGPGEDILQVLFRFADILRYLPCDRPILYTSFPNCLPSSAAVRVLPVPAGPWNITR